MPSAKPAAVGGFVLGALIIVVVAILFFGGPQAFSSKTKAVVYFDGSVGVRTMMRDLYGAFAPGTTFHLPSSPKVPRSAYDVAVPSRKYSASR